MSRKNLNTRRFQIWALIGPLLVVVQVIWYLLIDSQRGGGNSNLSISHEFGILFWVNTFSLLLLFIAIFLTRGGSKAVVIVSVTVTFLLGYLSLYSHSLLSGLSS